MNDVHFSSKTDRWFTPQWLYHLLDEEFHFDFDPALKSKVDWASDGLSVEWGKTTFCNPPYSDIDRWIAKAYREWLKGKNIVLLIPSRTDTRWWHDYVMRASEIRFIKGRITFEGAKAAAPFPSCIVVFDQSKGPTRFVSLCKLSPYSDHQNLFSFAPAGANRAGLQTRTDIASKETPDENRKKPH